LQFIVAKEYSYEMLIKQAREHSLELKMYKSDIKIQNTLVNEAYGIWGYLRLAVQQTKVNIKILE
jgi:hypothetical protein